MTFFDIKAKILFMMFVNYFIWYLSYRVTLYFTEKNSRRLYHFTLSKYFSRLEKTSCNRWPDEGGCFEIWWILDFVTRAVGEISKAVCYCLENFARDWLNGALFDKTAPILGCGGQFWEFGPHRGGSLKKTLVTLSSSISKIKFQKIKFWFIDHFH